MSTSNKDQMSSEAQTESPMEDLAEDLAENLAEVQAVDTAVESEQAISETGSDETEHGGPKGLEPTRFGDWEKNGRCSDF
jgi:hypothetical protein